jgi:transcription elongation factor SPT6
VYDLFEPVELERRHFTDKDDEIRVKDIPERFQLRSYPVIPEDEEGNELKYESDWIYRNAFSASPISDQHKPGEVSSMYGTTFKPPTALPKIREALAFMRNQSFEVPFIANYRKEYVEPELSVEDLWMIWQWDERWCKFQARKRNLVRLFAAVQDYQRQKIKDNQDHFLHEGQRVVLDKEIDKVDAMQSLEELKDAYDNFSLYYGNDLAEMRKAQKAQESMDDPTQASKLKSVKVAQKDFYTVCCQAGLLGMAEKFGLTPEHFGENLRDNYQRHETEQYPNEPEDVAQDYTCQKFPTVEAVLKAAVYMVAIQLSKEPVVRQTVRQTYSERSKVSVKPTKKGKKEIDEWHECSAFKYLKNKPVKTLRGDQFLRMTQVPVLTIPEPIDTKVVICLRLSCLLGWLL